MKISNGIGKSVPFTNVELSLIDQNENSRVLYKTGDLSELMESMAQHGLLQPIGLRKNRHDNRYEIIFGNRRLIAARKLGWHEIGAQILDIDGENERDILNLIENFKRCQPTVAEDGRMFKLLLDRGLTQSEIAARLGISKKRIENALTIVQEIPIELQKKIHRFTVGNRARQKQGRITEQAAIKILGLRRKLGLRADQARELLNFASQDEGSLANINAAVPFLKRGMNVSKALRESKKYRQYTTNFVLNQELIEKIENQEGRSITQIIQQIISSDKRFKNAFIPKASKESETTINNS